MKKVFKYQLKFEDYIQIEVPNDYKILSASIQHGIPCIWILVDPNNISVTLNLRMAGTGHPISDEIVRFIDTIELDNGSLIFHIFEIK